MVRCPFLHATLPLQLLVQQAAAGGAETEFATPLPTLCPPCRLLLELHQQEHDGAHRAAVPRPLVPADQRSGARPTSGPLLTRGLSACWPAGTLFACA